MVIMPHKSRVCFDPNRFEIPECAELLAVAESCGKTACRIFVYEREACGKWSFVFSAGGRMGANGMSCDRAEGDGTTPVGVWLMNTPFGQKKARRGFPESYVQVDGSYIWSSEKNRLVRGGDCAGELVGNRKYAGLYDYVIDMGYNADAITGRGFALFIHCRKRLQPFRGSEGCIKLTHRKMIKLMRAYGRHGDGKCFVAVGVSAESFRACTGHTDEAEA